MERINNMMIVAIFFSLLMGCGEGVVHDENKALHPCETWYDQDGDGSVDLYFTFTFNEKGQMIFETRALTEMSVPFMFTTRTYDSKDRVLVEKEYGSGEPKVTSHEYRTDLEGNVLEEFVNTSSGNFLHYTNRYVGEQMYKVGRELRFGEDDQLLAMWGWGYYSETHRPKSYWVDINADGRADARHDYIEYDYAGNLMVERIDLDHDGEYDDQIDRQYDHYHNVIETWLVIPGTRKYYQHDLYRHSYECHHLE